MSEMKKLRRRELFVAGSAVAATAAFGAGQAKGAEPACSPASSAHRPTLDEVDVVKQCPALLV